MPDLVVETGSVRPRAGASVSSSSRSEGGRGRGRTCMIAREFLDSNLLVYAYDDTDHRKQAIAQQLVERAVEGEMVASTQVLAEFAGNSSSQNLSPGAALRMSALFWTLWRPSIDAGTIRRAVEAHATYAIHFNVG